MAALAIDALIVVLLLAVLGFGVLLHLQLRRLREDGAALEQLIGALSNAAECADTALKSLRATASETGAQVERDLEQAQRVLSDLRLLSERADQQADRLLDLVRITRARQSAPSRGAAQAADTQEASCAAAGSPLKADLERALRALR